MTKSPNKNELAKYAGNYSESGLWSKLTSVAKKIGSKATWYALVLYYTLNSDEVSLGNKAIIMGALGYLILPIDLVPDVVPILGLTDDAAALKLAYDTIRVSVTPEIEHKASQRLCQWFGNSSKA